MIGRRTYRADAAAARAAVGGLTAVNDVSGRRAQLETPLRQFTLGKSFDTFAPMGPCIAAADGVDLESIGIRTTVSGEVMQDSSTKNLIFSIVELIVYCSAGMTLEPGDVIATGTPGGVGRLPHASALPARRRRGRGVGRRRRHAPKPGRVRALSRGLPAAAPGLVAPAGHATEAPDVTYLITARACRRTSRRSLFAWISDGSSTRYRTARHSVN